VRYATLDSFENWFNVEHGKVQLENGAHEIGPIVRPTVDPALPPWKVKWCIIFLDRKYIRATETYAAEPKWKGRAGYRTDFSFHYGDCPTRTTSDGWPDHRDQHQCDIRFDHDPARKYHLHFNGENHIPESRVHGCEISTLNIFQFVLSIQEHRRSAKPLNNVFGFTVEAPL
jgi:hypothetical protein